MTLSVRRASPLDAAALARLRFDFRAELGHPTEARADFLPRCEAWMHERLQRPGPWYAWVVESPAISGSLWLQLIEKLPNPVDELESHAYITSVYVTPSARNLGGGQALLDAAFQFCRGAGVDSVILWPSSRSRPLYERNGFAVPSDLLQAVLDPGRALADERLAAR
ncbi:MAG: N-acetyltransferase family protein [Dehalococcoidia bacterium]